MLGEARQAILLQRVPEGEQGLAANGLSARAVLELARRGAQRRVGLPYSRLKTGSIPQRYRTDCTFYSGIGTPDASTTAA